MNTPAPLVVQMLSYPAYRRRILALADREGVPVQRAAAAVALRLHRLHRRRAKNYAGN
ncbi:MAG: hypothetical protein LC745_07400 [Planctomycetia bacterium]|nr:hypothetical protein [Planctomycetia bacterium]